MKQILCLILFVSFSFVSTARDNWMEEKRGKTSFGLKINMPFGN